MRFCRLSLRRERVCSLRRRANARINVSFRISLQGQFTLSTLLTKLNYLVFRPAVMLAGSAEKAMRISPGKLYPNDRAQHLNATYRIVGPVSASCGQMIPTFERNRDANIYGRNMLHAFGHLVATRCDMLRVENRTSAHDWAQQCCTKT